ncbi:MAG TPA: ABC transporter permease [Alphaproteobacteria bacterium]|jgi:ABC-type polysaccharide/polyol phosphate export permease|nr:ABC transporter permease [Alphaproteobacteria bacterium]
MTDFDIGAAAIPDHRPLPKPPTMKQHLRLAWRDISYGLIDWRVWLLLGMNDIRQRYRRSRLGQFWITLAMATTIVSLGFLYAFLFKQPLEQYLPYLGTSFVVWGLISGIVLDSCLVFIGSEGFLRQVPMPKSVFVHRMLVRNVVTFGHNLIILPPLYFIFGVMPSWTWLVALVGFAVFLLNGIWVALLLGTISARFRDMPQTVASIMQIAYFLTPIMWQRALLPPKYRHLAELNPFQAFMSIVRDPLLGQMPPVISWEVVGVVTLAGFAVTTIFFSRFRARIVYWL